MSMMYVCDVVGFGGRLTEFKLLSARRSPLAETSLCCSPCATPRLTHNLRLHEEDHHTSARGEPPHAISKTMSLAVENDSSPAIFLNGGRMCGHGNGVCKRVAARRVFEGRRAEYAGRKSSFQHGPNGLPERSLLEVED